MRIIGIIKEGDVYLAEISAREIWTITGAGYDGKIKSLGLTAQRLRVGDEINATEMATFADKIQDACKKMRDASQAFQVAVPVMQRFSDLLLEERVSP